MKPGACFLGENGPCVGEPGAAGPLQRDLRSRCIRTISVPQNTSNWRLRCTALLITSACARMQSHSRVARSRRAGAQALARAQI